MAVQEVHALETLQLESLSQEYSCRAHLFCCSFYSAVRIEKLVLVFHLSGKLNCRTIVCQGLRKADGESKTGCRACMCISYLAKVQFLVRNFCLLPLALSHMHNIPWVISIYPTQFAAPKMSRGLLGQSVCSLKPLQWCKAHWKCVRSFKWRYMETKIFEGRTFNLADSNQSSSVLAWVGRCHIE